MTRASTRLAAALATLCPALITSFALAGPASSADNPVGPVAFTIDESKILGPLAIDPPSGDVTQPVTLTTAGSCPLGTHSVTRVYGPKLVPDGENLLVTNTPIYLFGSPPADRLTVPATLSLDEMARTHIPPVQLEGTYRLVLDCQKSFLLDTRQAYNFYVGKLRVHNNRYTALTTKKDLPKRSVAATGPEAIAWKEGAAERASESYNPDQTEQAAASRDSDGSNTGVALAVTCGIAGAGTGAVLVASRRSGTLRRAGKVK